MPVHLLLRDQKAPRDLSLAQLRVPAQSLGGILRETGGRVGESCGGDRGCVAARLRVAGQPEAVDTRWADLVVLELKDDGVAIGAACARRPNLAARRRPEGPGDTTRAVDKGEAPGGATPTTQKERPQVVQGMHAGGVRCVSVLFQHSMSVQNSMVEADSGKVALAQAGLRAIITGVTHGIGPDVGMELPPPPNRRPGGGGGAGGGAVYRSVHPLVW